jgi:DNA-binding NarL/FixJ family response regulator
MHSMTEPLKAQAKIILVDDHPVVLEGLTTLINRQSDLIVCAQAENSHEALQKIEEFTPDLVIIDLSLNGGGGLELIKQIKSLWPAMAMLVLSVHEESVYAERVLRAGARGYVMKQMATVDLLDAIRRVLAGGLSVSDQVSKGFVERMITGQPKAAKQTPIETLSDRELEVFAMIGRGLGTREIAKDLSLSVKTVETHCTHIKQKLNIKTSPLMIRAAVEWAQQKNH